VPGLVTEADTIETLSLKLERMVPDLLEANGCLPDYDVPFEILARKFSVAHSAVN
jgi:hypothetical protein